MGLFDAGAFAQTPGWLSALLQNPDLFNQGGIAQSNGFPNPPRPPGMVDAIQNNPPPGMTPPPQQPQAQAPGMNAMAQAPAMGAPQMPQQPYAPQNPTTGDKFMAGAANFSSGGNPIAMLANVARGFSTGQRMDRQGMAEAQQQGLYTALRQKGVDHPTAIAAMASPEIMKELGQFKQPQFVPNIGSDKFGQPRPGFIDPRTQTATLPNMAGGAAVPQTGGGDPSLTGEDYLNSLDKGTGAQVKAMLEGRMSPPSGMAAKTPYWQRMLDMAASAEPGFDLTKWTQRQAGNKDFYGGGKSAEMVRAANQTIHHVGELIGSMDKLSNTQSPQYNAVGNYINTNVLGKGAVTEFLPNAHAVAEEMSKVFKGANLSDAEIHQWEKSLNENMSPEQQRASVGKLMTLLNGSLSALETKRRSSLGDALSDQKGPLLDKESQHTLDKVNKWIGGESVAPAAKAAPQTATGPNGQKLILRGNQWVPIK